MATWRSFSEATLDATCYHGVGGGPPYIRHNESLREGFSISYLALFPRFVKINIYVKRFDPRNFEKPNITMPRLETERAFYAFGVISEDFKGKIK